MPSNFCFDVSPDHVSMRLTSGRLSPRYVVIDDYAANSTSALADRIQDYAKLLASKDTDTTIFLDQLPFEDEGHHAYKVMILTKDKSGKRKVLLEGEYEVSSSKSRARRKALKNLLNKSRDKVKEAMEKPKVITGGGKWVFLPD